MGVKLGLRIASPVGDGGTVLAAGAVSIGTAVFIAPAGSSLLIFVHGWFLFRLRFQRLLFCGRFFFFGSGRFHGLGGLFRLGSRGFGFRLGLFAPHRRLLLGGGGHAVPRVAGHHRDLLAVQLFDAGQILLLLRGAEADGGAVCARAGRAADAVDVSFRHFGQVVVEDMGQLADVDAASGDVGGDQHLGLPGLEAFQRGHTGGLALVAVDGGGRDALLVQVFCDLIRTVLGAAEDQRVLHRRIQVLDEPRQQEFLVALLDEVQALVDAVHRAGHGVHLDEGGVVQDARRQLLDLLGHGGAEHQVLAHFGQLCDDLLHVMHKAHVQHPVGLVQHEDLDAAEIDEPLPHKVVQAAGAGDEDIDALFDGCHLRGLTHTAENDGAAQGEVLAVHFKALADLQSQLTGGGEDQGADGPFLLRRVRGQAVKHGQRKGCGLAGARLGATHQVPPGQHRRDGRCLNGRGGFVTRLRNGTQQRGGQIQFVKSHGSPVSIKCFPLCQKLPLLGELAFRNVYSLILRHSM